MRYLIVEKERGLFLGAYRDYYLFARNNIFPIGKAPSFDTEADAEYYIKNYLQSNDRVYGVIQIDTKGKYVSIIDILKAGYSEYTHNLIDFIPMPSEAIH
jgi:hypothetical protein